LHSIDDFLYAAALGDAIRANQTDFHTFTIVARCF
jgi:hypothetical protein